MTYNSSVFICFIHFHETCLHLGATLWFPKRVRCREAWFKNPLPSNGLFHHNIIIRLHLELSRSSVSLGILHSSSVSKYLPRPILHYLFTVLYVYTVWRKVPVIKPLHMLLHPAVRNDLVRIKTFYFSATFMCSIRTESWHVSECYPVRISVRIPIIMA
jgi:hypothetical protein